MAIMSVVSIFLGLTSILLLIIGMEGGLPLLFQISYGLPIVIISALLSAVFGWTTKSKYRAYTTCGMIGVLACVILLSIQAFYWNRWAIDMNQQTMAEAHARQMQSIKH